VQTDNTTTFTQKTFPCPQCGASMIFTAKNATLTCEYCGSTTRFKPPTLPIYEHDLDAALEKIEKRPRYDLKVPHQIKCPVCAAKFERKPNIRSTRCPYCDAPIVTNLDIFMPLAPESLLPFRIGEKKAKEIFGKWVGSLWFAPSELSRYTRSDTHFEGIYLPYWTYDADTITRYQGQRGEIHLRPARHTVIDDKGRLHTIETMEEEIKWWPVSGEVRLHFDDILIGATRTLPRKLADSLGPWDLEHLVAYDEKYLSGFESETYSVALEDGFDYAKAYMEYRITEAVRRDIGGDRQEIDWMRIYHRNKTFKYILLPVWTAHFRYRDKTYRFAINARTGVIRGERPYSKMKIFLAILFALLLAATLFYFADTAESHPIIIQYFG